MAPSKPTDLEIAYRLTLGSNEAVLIDLLQFCGVWSPNLATEALEMARNEGRRLVGLHILHRLAMYPGSPNELTQSAQRRKA